VSLLIVYWLLFAVGGVGILGAIGACAVLLRRVRPLGGGATFVPLTGASLSMIVPIKGVDASTEANLSALVESPFRGEIEYLFAMESADDPAYAVCQRVRALHPDRDIRVVFSGPAGARMGKQHNLAAAVRAARYQVIGSMDADVRVAPTTLAVGLSYLAPPGVGIAYFLPGYTDQPSLRDEWPMGGALVALYSDYYFLANFGALALTRTQPAIIGGLWLVRRATLEAIGGLDQFTRVVSDDAALGKAIAAQKLRCVLVPHTVAVPFEQLDLRGGVRHLAKWLAMLRAEGLGTYLTILATWHPIFWSALALILGRFTPAHQWLPSLLLLGAAVVVRILTAVLLNLRVYRLPPLPLPLLAVAYELAGVPLLFGAGLFRRTIVWKGRRYRLGRHGVIRGAW
jgi:ceramide glucosyltransferase